MALNPVRFMSRNIYISTGVLEVDLTDGIFTMGYGMIIIIMMMIQEIATQT